MIEVLLAAEDAAEAVPLSWWVLTPTLVMLALLLAVSPIWPWSRRWGWTLAGMVGVTTITVIAFTIAWTFS